MEQYVLYAPPTSRAKISCVCHVCFTWWASVYEWSILEELVEILQPLEEATRELSAEKTVSCSKVIPLLNAILCELRKHIYDDDET